jgi:hypothetical protein
VEVLSGDDNMSKVDASTAKLKAPDDDDDEDEGTSSVEPIAPHPISSSVLVQTKPSVVDRAAPSAPPVGGHKQKQPPTVLKRKSTKTSADLVTTQIELPPYRGPKGSSGFSCYRDYFWASL